MLENIYNNERIGNSLLKDGLITEDQWKKALELHREKGGFIGKILVEEEFVIEEDLLSYFVEKYGLSYMPPANFPIDPENKKFLSEEIARKYLLLPVDKQGFRLTVICPGPLERALLCHALEVCKGVPVIYFLSTISDIEEAIEKLYKKE